MTGGTRGALIIGAAAPLLFACSRGGAPLPTALHTTAETDSAAPGPSTRDARVAPSLAQDGAPSPAGGKAEACFADPACALDDASALFLQADDAREPVDCFRFYYGIGLPRDFIRARACLARTISKCGGSSPDLLIATYTVMLIEAQGGPRDLSSAKRALEGCFEDITVTSLRERMQAPPSPGPPYDFCKDNGGTTLTTNACAALFRERAESERQKLARSTCANLPASARPLYVKAAEAWSAFAAADAWLIHDTERGGTIREAAAMRSQQIREEERQKRIARLLDYRPTPTSGETVLRAAEAGLDAARAAMAQAATDDEQRKMIRDAEDAWVAYHDAEIALYMAAFGDRFGISAVRDDVGVTLARARVVILRAEARGLPDYSSTNAGDASAP